ncbi:MAG TPA: LacI family DNA-binding transcriptional regulator [Symbiobacteriaceae bacterium]|nr:LacI family DNA-binding transcriptional regulator [Symbiobacteriaceae bacterium]
MPTARDVAKRAGVSQSTVSRVLNNYVHVRPDVRDRVLHAMKELQYQPNEVARSLVTQRSRSIGLVLGETSNPFFAETAKSIVEVCQGFGYCVILSTTDSRPDLLPDSLRLLRSQQVEGLIIGAVEKDDSVVAELVASGFPCVFYNRVLNTNSGSYVILNNVRGGHMMTEHLLGLGHRRIAVLTGPQKFSTFAHRLEGYAAALREQGIAFDSQLVLQYSVYTADRTKAIKRLLGLKNPPDAIFAMTDSMALEVMDTVLQLGLRVPEDIAVVGFDDIALASHHRICLTTIAQHRQLMGRLAAEALLEQINARAEGRTVQPTRIVLEPQLVIRHTCGSPIQR